MDNRQSFKNINISILSDYSKSIKTAINNMNISS